MARGVGRQSRPRIHPWRHSCRTGRSHGGLGHGFQDRARGSDGGFARRLSSRRDARCLDGSRRDRELRKAVLGCGSQGLRQGGSAVGKRSRHLSDSTAGLTEDSPVSEAVAFTNLGSLTLAGRDPDKIAIIDLGTGQERRFSYRDFEQQADAVARGLIARGLVRGDRVAILASNRFEYLTTVHGIMRAGLVAVPVNFKFPAATIDYIISDSGAKLVFCDAQRLDSAPRSLQRIVFDGDSGDFGEFLDPGPFTALAAERGEPAMFLYTSGSTGRPKGVVLSHQSHIWVVEQRMAAQDMSRHRFLIAAPLYHMNALAMSQLAHASHATIVLLPQFTARLYLHAIETYRCT